MRPRRSQLSPSPSRPSSPSSKGTRAPVEQEAPERASADLLRKVPPHDLEAEQAVLGGIFLNNKAFHNIVEILDEEDFYSPVHKTIYKAFLELDRTGKPIDLLTVADILDRGEELETVGGRAYLGDLAAGIVPSANAEYFAHRVRDLSLQRSLISVAAGIIQESYRRGADVEKLIDESEQSIFRIAERRATESYSSSKQLVEAVFEQLQRRAERQDVITGITTGYTRLNEYLAGLQPSDLVIIAARPSMGKTAFALNLALNAATKGLEETGVVVFSLEMSKEQLMSRFLCIQGEVDLARFRRGFLDDGDWAKLYDAAQVLTRAPIFIDDTPALSVLELRARCRRLKKEKNIGMIIVDYLQLMRASRNIDSREQEISDISRNLKALAKELHVPVLALSQLNRKVEERSNRRPMLSDLRESGAIEQDADVIMFIYRDEVYNKESPKKGTAEIIIGKQRNGPVGEVELAFLGQCTKFGDLAFVPEPSEYGHSG
ncbi:replicative DNA helicase [Desulfovibrio sp. X2]|uniref:replicative DNA helicase n=1 Tax=Desulfovibrio sp. X2 TaxID=941449 RepID=UPI000358D2B2|nr:replicative DNA helicase [Desulfovibrio sp. X2]EPR37426.1 replicative DNA helicase [Desulfovibrio sp. X2]